MSANPIIGFEIKPRELSFVGHGLNRPECVLTRSDGTLFCSDGSGGVMEIAADGKQTLHRLQISGESIPNGITLDSDGLLLIADMGLMSFLRINRDGSTQVVADAVNGKPIGTPNFVLRDHQERIWLTILCRQDVATAMANDEPTGYLAQLIGDEVHIRADSLDLANECRVDASGTWIYVVETRAQHITRFRISDDGSLSGREVFGPQDLGGIVDGIAFDAYGNLWGTLAAQEIIFALTPEGEKHVILDDSNPEALIPFEKDYYENHKLDHDLISACASPRAPIMTSIAFGGPDMKTVFIGHLLGDRLACFRSPVAGLKQPWW